MLKASDIVTIEKKIGYTFKNKVLLERAFTHSSASREATKNYESLEFLGDSLLDFIVAKRLMMENPDAHEGALTSRRAEIVSQAPLEKEIERLGLAKFMIVGKGESAEAITGHTKVKSNLFEAIVGAIYFDSGRLEDAEKFVLSKLRSHFDGSYKHDGGDHKTELNEFASKHKIKVEYRLIEQSGAPHDPTFKTEVRLDGLYAGVGIGKTKKEAEQEAAKMAMSRIKGSDARV